jgi:hypothetical protein
LSDQEEKKEGTAEAEEKVDSLSDLSELEKIKKDLEIEKIKAAKELELGEDEEEDLREVDHLQKLITLAVQFDHAVGMFMMPSYIDCGLKYDHKLTESYLNHLNTIQGFLRLLEKVDGVTREMVTKDCIVKLRNVVQLIHKNQVKPLYKELDLMKKKPTMENLDNFKNAWNEKMADLQKACDFEYQILDVKKFLIS